MSIKNSPVAVENARYAGVHQGLLRCVCVCITTLPDNPVKGTRTLVHPTPNKFLKINTHTEHTCKEHVDCNSFSTMFILKQNCVLKCICMGAQVCVCTICTKHSRAVTLLQADNHMHENRTDAASTELIMKLHKKLRHF